MSELESVREIVERISMSRDRTKRWRCMDRPPAPEHPCPIGGTCGCCGICLAICEIAARLRMASVTVPEVPILANPAGAEGPEAEETPKADQNRSSAFLACVCSPCPTPAAVNCQNRHCLWCDGDGIGELCGFCRDQFRAQRQTVPRKPEQVSEIHTVIDINVPENPHDFHAGFGGRSTETAVVVSADENTAVLGPLGLAQTRPGK